jgi:hypothetical protein
MRREASTEDEILTPEELSDILADAMDATPEEIKRGGADLEIAPPEEADVVESEERGGERRFLPPRDGE